MAFKPHSASTVNLPAHKNQHIRDSLHIVSLCGHVYITVYKIFTQKLGMVAHACDPST